MNVFIILSILIIVIGVLLLVVAPSVLFKLNWKEKTGKEKILMFMFYSIVVYIINIIYWIIKWAGGAFRCHVLRVYDKIIAIANKTRVIDQEEKNKIFNMY